MIMNEYSDAGMPYTGQLLGSIPLRESAEHLRGNNYQNMTEAEREHLIMRCKDAKNTEQRQKVVEELAPDMDFRALAAETGMFGEYRDGMR